MVVLDNTFWTTGDGSSGTYTTTQDVNVTEGSLPDGKVLVIDAYTVTISANYFKIHPDGELHIQNGGSLVVSNNTKLTNTGIILDKTSDKTSDSNYSTQAITIQSGGKINNGVSGFLLSNNPITDGSGNTINTVSAEKNLNKSIEIKNGNTLQIQSSGRLNILNGKTLTVENGGSVTI
jgi:hypothetical protein